jgi:hypothetical protein
MKTITVCYLLAGAVAVAQDFINLNFDNPDLGSLTPVSPGDPRTAYSGNPSQVLRGWTVSINGISPSRLGFQPGLGNTVYPISLVQQPVGDYRLLMESLPPNQVNLRVSQTALIPASAFGLSFFSTAPLEVDINGTVVYTVDFDAVACGPVPNRSVTYSRETLIQPLYCFPTGLSPTKG